MFRLLFFFERRVWVFQQISFSVWLSVAFENSKWKHKETWGFTAHLAAVMWHNPHPPILCCCRVALNRFNEGKNEQTNEWLVQREEKSVSLVRLYLCIRSHQRNVKHDVLNKQFLPFCALLRCTIFRTVHVTSNRNACNTESDEKERKPSSWKHTRVILCL